MNNYWIKIKRYFLYILWLIAVVVSFFDMLGSLVEFFTFEKVKYLDFSDWRISNFPNLLLIHLIVLNFIVIICMFFSFKNIKTDSLKAVLIMTVPLIFYNVFTCLNLM